MGKGGAKKFLYTGPKKDTDEEEDVSWNFNSKSPRNKPTTGTVNGGSQFGVDDVWSIKRNVNVGGLGGKEPKSDGLTFSTNKSYYSRHGNGSKEKDDFGAFGNSTEGTNNTQTDSLSRNKGPVTSKTRPFSYAYGPEAQTTNDPPVSPRNISNSSTGTYSHSVNMNGFSNTGSAMDSGNNGFSNGGSSMNSGNNGFSHGGSSMNSGNNLNSINKTGRNSNFLGGDKLSSNTSSGFNKSSSSHIVNQTSHAPQKTGSNLFSPNTAPKSTLSRNQLFNNNKNDSVNKPSPFESGNKNDKSFW